MDRQIPNRPITEIQFLKGVGPKRATIFNKEGIFNVRDLFLFFPKSYIDRTSIKSIKDIYNLIKSQEEREFKDENIKTLFDYNIIQEHTVIATIVDKVERNLSPYKKILTLKIKDTSNFGCKIQFWNSANYFGKLYNVGQKVVVSGKPELNEFGLSFTHPDIEIIDEEDAEIYSKGIILPKYKSSELFVKAGITQKYIRKVIFNALHSEVISIADTLPRYLLEKYEFGLLNDSIKNIHFPASKDILEKTIERFKFEEVFYYELVLALNKKRIHTEENAPLLENRSLRARTLFDSLPFQLTPDQKKVLNEVANDFKSGKPMNRLLQGDVGSGKTIVSIFSALMAIDNGFQVCILAPTEILAEQHYKSFKGFLEPLGIKISIILGSQKGKARTTEIERISSGEINIIVGTHAIFQTSMKYHKLGFIIIDEQHRFGVSQRGELMKLALNSKYYEDNNLNLTPHILLMSATPIPRTLTMSVYGDLDISLIKTMPKDRLPIKTKVSFESHAEEVFEFVKDEVKSGRQAYIIYPLVEKSEKLNLKSAVEHFEMLSSEEFKDFRCALLHGQMNWQAKDEIMIAFKNKEYDILISTTVIEVGIDVPNASVIVIENAERFGLSQLHQLRGRVGRGIYQSYCILMTKDYLKFPFKNSNEKFEKQSSIARLKAMEQTSDGFEISEIDLKLRGPGDILGTQQSGIPDFKFIDLAKDDEIIKKARKEAFLLADNDIAMTKEIRGQLQRNPLFDHNFYRIA